MIKGFKGKKPDISKDVYIAENSTIIGDVILKNNVSVWFGSTIRGDIGSIIVGENTNIQENCVIHVDDNRNVSIGDGCTIGHGAIIHGCSIGENVLIGMGATILNGAQIGNNTIVGAGSLITENKKFEDGVLILGSPAKVVRALTEDEIDNNRKSCLNYINLSKDFKKDQEEN